MAFTFFNSGKETLFEDTNLETDSFKWMLTNTAPLSTNTVPGDITEITAAFGYTAGGTAVTVASSSQVSGTYTWTVAACAFTAAGGDFAPFRYLVLTNTTVSKLLGYVDYGSSYTLTDGNSFTIPSQPVFSA